MAADSLLLSGSQEMERVSGRMGTSALNDMSASTEGHAADTFQALKHGESSS
jgi:hypothetical protein